MVRRVFRGGFAFLLLLVVGNGGCRSPILGFGGASPRSPHEESLVLDQPAPASPAAAQSAANTIEIVDLAFDVLRIEIPLKGVQHSRKIWNHVDELRTTAQQVAHLGRNGLRLGVVREGAWPAIRAVLDAGNADVRKDQLFSPSGLPLNIGVGRVAESESVFFYDADHQLVGKTFSGGDKVMEVNYIVHSRTGGRVDLQIGLEIRRDLGVMTWERSADGIRQVPDYERHVFAGQRTVIPLEMGESLLIGPGEETGNEYVVGSRFFTGEQGGDRFEALYCITPIPHRHVTAWHQEP